MPVNLTIDFTVEQEVIDYLDLLDSKKHPLRHENYVLSIEHSEAMAVHFSGADPKDLLDSWRPNESQDARDYRLSIYEPTTKSNADKIINTLSKIQKSGNSSVEFPTETDAQLKEDTLEEYIFNYPIYGRLDNWIFGPAMESMLIDPNAVAVFMPERKPDDDTKFLDPVGRIYSSEMVVDKWEGVYYSILLDTRHPVKNGNRVVNEGNVYLFIDKSSIVKATQVRSENGKRIYNQEVLYDMDFDKVPAFELKGDVMPSFFPLVYESYTSGVLPYWNKVVRMTSDLDAQFVQHMYLERVEMEVECDAGCEQRDGVGSFVILKSNGKPTQCKKCSGTGKVTGRSPYGVTSIKRDSFVDKDPIFPGVTYIEKNTDIVKLADEKIQNLIDQGFSSVNMDVLIKSQDNQSGIAKQLDREPLNDYLLKVSDNVFDNLITNSITYINWWRYSFLGDESLESQMPSINKPTSFDVETTNSITRQLQDLENTGTTNNVKLLLERDLVDKRFPNDQGKRDFNKTVIELDPLAGYKPQDKVEFKLNQGVSQSNFVISVNIDQFVIRAISEDPEFTSLDFATKMKKMNEYALDQSKIDTNNSQQLDIRDENGNIEESEDIT